MSIQKPEVATIKQVGLHVVTLPSEIIRAIKNPDALAIWTYLLTMADNWEVRKSAIREHFQMPDGRYKKAMQYLSDLGLVIYTKNQGENNQFSGTQIQIMGLPRNLDVFLSKATQIERQPNKNAEGRISRASGFAEPRDFPSVGILSPLSKDQDLLSNDQDLSLAPANFSNQVDLLTLDQVFENIGKLSGFTGDLQNEWFKFIGHMRATGKVNLERDRYLGEWQKWIGKAKGYVKRENATTGHSGRQNVDFNDTSWADNIDLDEL